MNLDLEILATKSQLTELIDSLAWKDVDNELEKQLEILSEDYDGVDNLLELGRIQGRREAISYLRRLPHSLLAILEQRSKEENETFVQNLNEGETEVDDES